MAHGGDRRALRYAAEHNLPLSREFAVVCTDRRGRQGRLSARAEEFLPLAQAARAGTSILNIAQPYLDELNRKFGEAVTLDERIGHESIPLLRLESRHSVKMMHSRGQMLPWPAAASSKALLAFAPPGDQDAIFRLPVPVQFTRTLRSGRSHCRGER